MTLRLGTVLADHTLGLRLAVGDGADVGDRPVRGAHAIELPDPGRFIDPDWIVLTTGMALSRSVERQRTFVRSLVEADVAALGFGVGAHVANVPRALLAEASAAGLPVFVVPLETMFSTVVQRVMERVLQGTGPQLGSLIAMQEQLVAALRGPDSERAVLELLAGMLGAEGGVVVGADVVASVGAPPWDELLDQVAARHGYRAHDGRAGICVPLDATPGPERFLAVAVPRGGSTEHYARPLTRFAAVVLQMAATGRRVAARQERALRAALLGDLLAAGALDNQLVERVKSFAFDPAQPVRCAVVRPPTPASGAASEACFEDDLGERAAAAIDQLFAERQIARLVRGDACELIAMWQGSYTGAGLLDVLAGVADAGAVVAGIGPVGCLDARVGLARAVSGARAAAMQASADPGGDRLVTFEELSYCDLLLASVPVDHHRAAPSPVEVLRQERGELLTTLVSYFDHDLDVIACARALSLHPNSLRYRISRVEQLLGRSLKSPATITDLYLALRAERIHGRPPGRAVPAAARHAARGRAPLA